MRIILIGPPGSGKGVQAKLLSQSLKIPHMSVGDLFRNEIKKQTPLGKKTASIINKGNLMPDDITIDVIRKRLQKPDAKNGFVLDGFPRTRKQAELMFDELKINFVFNINVSDDVVVKRLTSRRQCAKCNKIYGGSIQPKKKGICDECGVELIQRKDDTEQVIRERLNEYHKNINQILEFYDPKGVVADVEGDQSVEKVHKDIVGFYEKPTKHNI